MIISPTLFNIIVDNVVRNWLDLAVEDKVVFHEGLGLGVGHCLGSFYAGNSMVGSWDPEWTQGAINVLIDLSWRYGLVSNVAKSKAMVCQPGVIRSGMLEEAVG